MSNHLFSSIFVLLCFLFVINGANLIDGFNGLLAINLIIVNIILTYININGQNLEFSILLISQIIIFYHFYYLTFQMQNIFGDSGAYTIGAFDWFKYNFYKQFKSLVYLLFLLYIFFIFF